MPSKAIEGAKRKGREAAEQGKPRICPYEDKRTSYHNGVTFSEAFRRAWFTGYDEALSSLADAPPAGG